jgi:hypothetical protein
MRGSAELLLAGWTIDDDGPLSPPKQVWTGSVGRDHRRLVALDGIEGGLWQTERAAHTTARLTPSRRLPVYLNALEPPSRASSAALAAASVAALAAERSQPRKREFAADKYWKSRDANWTQTRAAISLPFLVQIAGCLADGLFAAASFRRGTATRTILIGRPRLRLRRGRLHAADAAAVVWPDGSERWYWDGVPVPERIAAARDELTADLVARIENQELRRVALERMGWERFLATADAQRRAQDDYGTLWATGVWIGGEQVHLVEVVNATAEQDGSYRRYFLRVPPITRTAREAVAWTFGFQRVGDYIVAAAS